VLTHLPQIKGFLHPQPRFRRGIEQPPDPNRDLGAQAALFDQQFGYA